jgi:site-specific recombinase XerD
MSGPERDQQFRILRQTDLAQDITGFLIDRQARGLTEGTVAYYADELRRWQSYVEDRGVHHVQDVTPALLRECLLDLGSRRNPGGVYASYRPIRTFLRWYGREYEPQAWSNPIRKVQAPRVPQRPLDPVPLSDVKAMLATCERRTFTGDRDRAILLALLDTGCRASEFVALDLDDVNLQSGAVIIREGKGRKFRTAFLGAKTRREVVRYLRHRESGGPLWVTVQGTRLTYSGLRQIVQRRAARADVPTPSLHSFRRAFALTCLRGGMDVYSLQKLTGHSDLSVLRRYLAQTEADLKLAHDEAGPVDNLL